MSEVQGILAAPYTVWLAPVGTSFPDVDEAPAGDWVKLGSNGDLNYTEAGVIIEHDQTITQTRAAGTTGPIAAHRTEESLLVRLTLQDMTPAEYAKVLNDAAITTTSAASGVPGKKAIPLMRGSSIAKFALIARGASPAMDGGTAQYLVPITYNAGQQKPAYVKGVAVGLECIWTALVDADAATEEERFGKYEAQTAAATS
jgi:hypothetical protein